MKVKNLSLSIPISLSLSLSLSLYPYLSLSHTQIHTESLKPPILFIGTPGDAVRCEFLIKRRQRVRERAADHSTQSLWLHCKPGLEN